MCCVLRSSIACALPSALYLSCFASPALSVDAGFFSTSSLALHLSRFISLCCVVWRLVSYTSPFVLCLPCVIGRHRILHHFVSCTSPFTLHSLCCVVWRLVSALCLSCFASPALSVDTGFFITSSLALHLSRFILCAVSFGALSLHFAFRALPPLRYQSTPDSSSLRLLHFTFRASFLCAVSFGALPLAFRLSVSYFP